VIDHRKIFSLSALHNALVDIILLYADLGIRKIPVE